ncbi:hypothetical protein G6020_09390 [Dietzia sp. B19]|uniref:hypothetical protein n=1 Tax=Dietzia sp. B19 TaxID=1630632 RepID=UPI0015F9FCBB|nr:hypothetical protein [Dietzia sp. B19]MBB1057606.1 hypothetical protein [Dietzia sp. B19]
MRLFALVASTAFLLTACGESADDPGGSADRGAAAPDSPAAVELVATGFGQQDGYVRGIAVVTSEDENAVGEFVTVSMNFLDSYGGILGTSDQVESMAWAGQELVLPVWFDLSSTPGAEVAEVDASVSISDHGMAHQEVDPIEPVASREIRADQYGGTTAVFELTNPSGADMNNRSVSNQLRRAVVG